MKNATASANRLSTRSISSLVQLVDEFTIHHKIPVVESTLLLAELHHLAEDHNNGLDMASDTTVAIKG